MLASSRTSKLSLCFIILALSISTANASSENLKNSKITASGIVSSDGRENEEAVLKLVTPILRQAGKAGRIYFAVNCPSDENSGDDYYPYPFPKLDLQAPSKSASGIVAIREIFKRSKNVAVEEDPSGIIRIRIGQIPDTFLKIKIPLISFKPEERFNDYQGVWAINGSNEIRAVLDAPSKHTRSLPGSWLASFPMDGELHLPETIKYASVDQAFDIVARTFGGTIVFGTCTKQRWYRAEFTQGYNYEGNDKWYLKAAEHGDVGAQIKVGDMYYRGYNPNSSQVDGAKCGGQSKGNYEDALKWYRKAADQGSSIAQKKIGDLYFFGLGVKKDYRQAEKWFLKAALDHDVRYGRAELIDHGDQWAQARLGDLYKNGGNGIKQNYEEALRWYRKAADQGNLGAERVIGLMYKDGHGVKQDNVEALKWLKMAAGGNILGDAKAKIILAAMYFEGEGVQQNYPEAFRYLNEAAVLGNGADQAVLGAVYESGLGVKYDYAEALNWDKKSARQNSPSGQYNLGTLYLNGHGVTQDYAEAMRWFKKAADQGYAPAQYSIGQLYARGHGVEQNYPESTIWIRKAANRDFFVAQNSLANLYSDGMSVPADYKESYFWFMLVALHFRKTLSHEQIASVDKRVKDRKIEPEKSFSGGLKEANDAWERGDYNQAMEKFLPLANQGNSTAQYKIGDMETMGQGVKRDYSEALKWFHKASDLHDPNADFRIGEMYENGWGVKQDYAQAMTWYQKAASEGNMDAEYGVGSLYGCGCGVAPDSTEALNWYRKAADHGSIEAKEMLASYYFTGTAVPVNVEDAYYWQSLAALEIAKKLTPEEISSADKRAAEWKPTIFKTAH